MSEALGPPATILGAHVFVKLAFAVIGLALMVLAGPRIIPVRSM